MKSTRRIRNNQLDFALRASYEHVAGTSLGLTEDQIQCNLDDIAERAAEIKKITHRCPTIPTGSPSGGHDISSSYPIGVVSMGLIASSIIGLEICIGTSGYTANQGIFPLMPTVVIIPSVAAIALLLRLKDGKAQMRSTILSRHSASQTRREEHGRRATAR